LDVLQRIRSVAFEPEHSGDVSDTPELQEMGHAQAV
jgi:hypothetical protein